MKNDDQEIILLNTNNTSGGNQKKDSIRTTNVNILLNRVRLNKKRTFKKRIIFSLFLVAAISSLTIYFII